MRKGIACIIALSCLLTAGTALAELPVAPGDIAFGLSNSSPATTTEQVRGCAHVGNWTALGYVQSTEFDNYNGILHNAQGNLLALNYGPSWAGGNLYNLSTDGSDVGQVLFDFDGSLYFAETNVAGLSVSPDNQYVACFGYDTGKVMVLEYNEGAAVGTGTGASVGNGYETAAAAGNLFYTQGTTWLDNSTILLYAVDNNDDVSYVKSISFNGSSLGTPFVEAPINSSNTGDSKVTDIEYNPNVSPYIFCHFSSYTPTQNTLTVLDTNFNQVDQIALTGLNTGREIALGPDGYLYISQYGGDIHRIDVSTLPIAGPAQFCYAGGSSGYNGIDVAHGPTGGDGACCVGETCSITTEANCTGEWLGSGTGCDPNPCLSTGACCLDLICEVLTETECTDQGGVYQGDDTLCTPNPCLYCIDIPTAKSLPYGTEVKICDVVVTTVVDPVYSSSVASFTVQHPDDATPVGGITVFGDEATIQQILSLYPQGTNVNITGELEYYNGLLQITGVTPATVEENIGGSTLVTPTLVTGAQIAPGSPDAELYESMLVTIECVTVADSGTWEGFNTFVANDTTGLVALRVPNDNMNIAGEPIIDGEIDVTAVLTQYDESSPYDGDYSLNLYEPTDVVASAGGCPTPFGACCEAGVCTIGTQADCVTGSYLGDGTWCVDDICCAPVESGDIAYGLSSPLHNETLEHIRGGNLLTHWAHADRPYIQSVTFDNLNGVLHNAAGNLLGLNFGGPNEDGFEPDCADYATRPEEGGKLYSMATDGSNDGQLIYEFNTGATPPGITCTRVGSVSVSHDNQYIAVWGFDTAELIVLEYQAGNGDGTGALITDAWVYTDFAWYTSSTQATAWLDNDTIIVGAWNGFGADIWTIDFDPTQVGNEFSATLQTSIAFDFTGNGQSIALAYNPQVNADYVYLLASKYEAGASITTLVALDPTTWNVVNSVEMSDTSETGREIAIGPDGYLYWSAYNYGDGPAIETLNGANPASWTDGSSDNYYYGLVYTAYNGLDVAIAVEPLGACCAPDASCTVTTEADCDGNWLGEGTDCDPNPCELAGACCLETGACIEVSSSECSALGGTYQGDLVLCADVTCPVTETIVINEVWADDPGADDNEFIELFGTPGTSLAGLSLIVVDGDTGGDTGSSNYRRVTVQVDFIAADVLDANGYLVIGDGPDVPADLVLPLGSLQNGTQTYALVNTLDIEYTVDDPDELTQAAVDAITATNLDTVATWDNGDGDHIYFGAPIVQDGTFPADHMFRCPNGGDTDSATDWLVVYGYELSDPDTPATPGADNSCQTWCLGDMNCSGGSPTFEDILYFAAAVGNEAGWIQYYQNNNGGQDPPCPWLLGDYNGGGVEFSDIVPFANSVGQDCIPY